MTETNKQTDLDEWVILELIEGTQQKTCRLVWSV